MFLRNRWLALFPLVLCMACQLQGQASYTASRIGDLQVGGGFTIAKPDYTQLTFKGFDFYTTFDFRSHFGAELGFHQVDTPASDQIYERTYEVGLRYFRTYGRFKPYAKIMYGRGVFNFPLGEANLAYNLYAPGVGVDYRLLHRVNLRVDYEYQSWHSFQGSGLSPQLLTFGAAYHFPGELRKRKR